MNYLAHAVLSFNNDSVLVGQFIADDVKGNQWMNYETDIRNGILLHRFIDDFTDNHAAVLELKLIIYMNKQKKIGFSKNMMKFLINR